MMAHYREDGVSETLRNGDAGFEIPVISNEEALHIISQNQGQKIKSDSIVLKPTLSVKKFVLQNPQVCQTKKLILTRVVGHIKSEFDLFVKHCAPRYRDMYPVRLI